MKAALAAVEAAGGVVRIPAPKSDVKKPTGRAKRASAARDGAAREETEQAEDAAKSEDGRGSEDA